MMNEYEIVVSEFGNAIIKRTDSEENISWIPVDEGNADYQQYLVDTNGGLPLPKETKEDK
jgi:hypothetical protein